MTRHYYVDPSVQATDPLPEPDGVLVVQYQEGVKATLPTGETVGSVTHLPSLNLFRATEHSGWSESPSYYVNTVALHFVANADPALVRVEEEAVSTQKPIEDIRAAKHEELRRQYFTVRLAAYDVPENGGGDNWAVIADEEARANIASIATFLDDRNADIVQDIRDAVAASADWASFQVAVAAIKPRWPEVNDGQGGQMPYPAEVLIRHKTNGNELVYQLTNANDWGRYIIKPGGLFDQETRAAWIDADQDINGASDPNALIAIDVVADYAWPEYWPE